MSKHTPGPWSTYVEKWPNKIVIRSMFTDGTERAQVAVTSAENAHLISAAPRMYARIEMLASEGDAEAQEIVEAVNGRA